MAKLGSMQLLSLCLVTTLFVTASCANDTDSCMFFRAVVPATTPGIKANSDVYENRAIYTGEWRPISLGGLQNFSIYLSISALNDTGHVFDLDGTWGQEE